MGLKRKTPRGWIQIGDSRTQGVARIPLGLKPSRDSRATSQRDSLIWIQPFGVFRYITRPWPTGQHNVVTALQNVASLHAVQLCYSVGSSLCNVVNGTRKAVNCNVVQRCDGSCTTLPNVIQRCAMLSHRCQTLSNVVQRCNKAVRCCIKAVQRFKLYNAAIVQRCATLPNVIQRSATLKQRCQTLYNAVQRCNNVAKRYTMQCNIVTKLCVPSCATLIHFIQRCTTL